MLLAMYWYQSIRTLGWRSKCHPYDMVSTCQQHCSMPSHWLKLSTWLAISPPEAIWQKPHEPSRINMDSCVCKKETILDRSRKFWNATPYIDQSWVTSKGVEIMARTLIAVRWISNLLRTPSLGLKCAELNLLMYLLEHKV